MEELVREEEYKKQEQLSRDLEKALKESELEKQREERRKMMAAAFTNRNKQAVS